jgi:histidine triad (HIT) family protein
MSACIFCKILVNELPASIVYRNESVAAFLDIRPVNRGHLLVVPNLHAETLADLPEPIAQEMMAVAQRLAGALRRANLRCDGVNLFLADGAAAGQEVPHVHLHVIPRNRDDGFGLRLAPGYGTVSRREELDAIAAAIRDATGLGLY